MNKLTLYALSLRLWLEAIHPMTPWLALSLGAWATVYLWRKLLPGLWLCLETLDKPLSIAIGALPSVIMTTAVGALTAGSDPWIVVGASLMGVAAPLFHHLLKALPIPYRGEPTAKPVPTSRTMLLLVLMCGGCGSSQREICYAESRARFVVAQESCDDEACIDDLLARRKAEQEACP